MDVGGASELKTSLSERLKIFRADTNIIPQPPEDLHITLAGALWGSGGLPELLLCKCLASSVNLRFEKPYIGKTPIPSLIIHSITDHKAVFYGKASIIHGDIHAPAR